MQFFLQNFALALIGLLLAIGLGFLATPYQAVAPSDYVPVSVTPATTPQLGVTETATSTPPTATSTPKKVTTKPKPKTPTPPPIKIENPVTTIVETLKEPEATTTKPLSVNETVRNSVVNIFCTGQSGDQIKTISASGVLIDSRGVILTNSHVAQHLLLKNYPTPNSLSCSVRTGSPATPKYTFELLYLPPAWIQKNAQKIDDERPTGNGEYDYALLRITGVINPDIPIPVAFPFLPVSLVEAEVGQQVLVAAYPAGFLGGITIQKDLFAASSLALVRELLTYKTQTLDLFSVGGSIVAQQGSSGGAVANDKGHLIGLIVTSTDAPDTSSRDLKAITMPYIIRDFEDESGISLATFLSENLALNAQSYALGIAPTLSQMLINVLQGQ